MCHLAPSGSDKGKRSIHFTVNEFCNRAKADDFCKCLSDHLKETPYNPRSPVLSKGSYFILFSVQWWLIVRVVDHKLELSQG